MPSFSKLKIGLLAFLCCFISVMTVEAKSFSWGIPKGVNNQQPWPGQEFDDIIHQNDAYYIGPAEEKSIYLTFDCGYENGNTPRILDVLKQHNVPALFFVTGHFMEECPELVQRIVDEGHIIGNHTYYHPNLTKVSEERFDKEMRLVEEKYTEITGKELVRVLRPPEGCFSQEMLDWASARGYYTILWSLAYMDWDVNNQRGENYAYQQVLSRIHPGAIILMHSISKDNAQCLDELVPELRKQGYEFKSIQYLLSRDLPEPME